jgi:tRNA (guanine-N7-)-methyltransferase
MPLEPRRRIEREFGVPIAGEILDASLWSKTALKHLPPTGQLDWQAIFGRKADIVLDLGCGNGRFLLGSAVWRPQLDHLGIDVLPVVIRYATRRGNQRGLTNIRFAVIDAAQFLERYTATGAIAEIHCYHPQPYYDPALIDKRLLTPEFLALVHNRLAPTGQFFIQSDNEGYWNYLRQILPVFFHFEERRKAEPAARSSPCDVDSKSSAAPAWCAPIFSLTRPWLWRKPYRRHTSMPIDICGSWMRWSAMAEVVING